jgi:pyruvate/2-oxoglutarate dehydrogenase complex dihydrolipoamide dehydrogenase (E3) component
VELAQALSRFGAKVSIVEGNRLLAREGREAGDAIAHQLKAEGIELHLGVHADHVAAEKGGITVRLEDGATISAERILVATGRRPRIHDLGLETIGLDTQSGHVDVDAQLRTGADSVWAIGDVTGVALFTHVGKYQARIAAATCSARTRARTTVRCRASRSPIRRWQAQA